MGLASCMWLVGTVHYLDTASGHEPIVYTSVMNKFIQASSITAIDSMRRFL